MRKAVTAALASLALASLALGCLALGSLAPAMAQTAEEPAGQEPGGAQAPAAARIQRSGTLKITVVLDASASLPNNTNVSITAFAQTFDATYSNSATLSGSTRIAAGKVNLTMNIPYTWVVASAANKVTVNLSMSASATTAAGTFQNSGALSKTFTLPANNKTTTVAFTGSI